MKGPERTIRVSDKKVVQSAVVIIPPEDQCGRIQEIRKIHDKGLLFRFIPFFYFQFPLSFPLYFLLFFLYLSFFTIIFFFLVIFSSPSISFYFFFILIFLIGYERWMPHINLLYPFLPDLE